MKKRANTTPTNPVPKRASEAGKRELQPPRTRRANQIQQQATSQPIQEQPSSAEPPKSAFAKIREVFAGSSNNQGDISRSVSQLSINSKTSQLSLVSESSKSNITEASFTSNATSKSNYDEEASFGGTNRGPERDLIEIDILSLDGECIKTNFTEADIYTMILRCSLGFRRSQINAIYMGWRGHQYVQVRLKEIVSINDYAGIHECEKEGVDQHGNKIKHRVKFEVRGYRPKPKSTPFTQAPDNWIRWVKVEHTGLEIEKSRVKDLLSKFGTILTDPREITITFKDGLVEEDDDPDEVIEIGTGKLEAQMQIATQIPQYIPAFGRKIKIYYKGIEKQCTNCYAGGHYKSDCSDERLDWLDYVVWFMETFPEINRDYLGRWYILATLHKANRNKSETESKKPETDQANPEQEQTEIKRSSPPAVQPTKEQQESDVEVDETKLARGSTRVKNTQPTVGDNTKQKRKPKK